MTIATVQWNTRERAISSDMNRQAVLDRRAIVELGSHVLTGSSRQSGVIGQSSFLATPQNGTLKSAITPGLALFFDSSKAYPESKMVWIESDVIMEVTHDPGDASARYDVIEMQPGSEVTSTQPRDQFDPLTGTFSVVNMAKEVRSKPVLQIRKGTPAAVPSIPTGTAGWIPLAYVLVPAGAASLVNTNVVYCRPLLGDRQVHQGGWTSSPIANILASDVVGGGVTALGGNLVAFVANAMEGRFAGHYHKFRLAAAATLRLTTMTWDGGGLPGADTLLYFYAIPPPYPAGYDASMAPREIWTPDSATLYGTSGGFYDVNGQEGCIIVASTSAPDLTHPAGSSTGSGSFSHSFFSNVASPSVRSQWAYIGAAYYIHATTEIGLQRASGATIATQRKPAKSFFADLPIIAPGNAYNLRTAAAGDPAIVWPITAVDIDLQIRAAVNNAGSLTIGVTDVFGDEANNHGVILNSFANNSGAQQNVGGLYRAFLSSTGNVTIYGASHVGGASARLIGKSYRDAVLALR